MPKILKEETYEALIHDQKELAECRKRYQDVLDKYWALVHKLEEINSGLSFQKKSLEDEKKKAMLVSKSAQLSVQAARQEARNAKERSKRLKVKNSELIQRLRDFTTDVSRL